MAVNADETNPEVQDKDMVMSDSDDVPLPASASASNRKANLSQSIGSLRDVEMCDDDNKHTQHSLATTSSPPKTKTSSVTDDDDLYHYPSSSRPADNDIDNTEEVDNEDEDEDMTASFRQDTRHNRDHYDEDEDEENNETGEDATEGSADDDEREDENPFRTAQSLASHFQDPFGTMPQLVNGITYRVTPCLDAITQRDDPMNVMVGLQEFAELILMTNEETLMEFLPTPKVLEALTDVMVDPLFEDNVEISLMACRCLCNILDANPSSLDKHSYSRVVGVLCQKLFEIQYIDIAEQALTVSLFSSKFLYMS